MKKPERKEVRLPFVHPYINSYPTESCLFAILLNSQKTNAWIFNYFINLYGYQLENNYIHLAYSFDNLRKICPFISSNQIDKDLLENKFKNPTDLIIFLISLNQYIFAEYDRYYISKFESYKKKHFIHQLFIYGFNTDSRKFIAADFFTKNQYYSEEIDFDELDAAISNVPAGIFKIETLKYRDYDYNFNLELFLNEIHDYMNSTKTILNYEEHSLTSNEQKRLYNKEFVFGIANYDLLVNELRQIGHRDQKIKAVQPSEAANAMKSDSTKINSRMLRSCHVLYEHKVLMVKRLCYLKEINIIKNAEIIMEFKEIEELSFSSRNMFIKYFITYNINIIAKIIEKINLIKLKEHKLMKQLYNQLKLI